MLLWMSAPRTGNPAKMHDLLSGSQTSTTGSHLQFSCVPLTDVRLRWARYFSAERKKLTSLWAYVQRSRRAWILCQGLLLHSLFPRYESIRWVPSLCSKRDDVAIKNGKNWSVTSVEPNSSNLFVFSSTGTIYHSWENHSSGRYTT